MCIASLIHRSILLFFSVDYLGAVPVYDVVERDGVVCDCWLVLLRCCGFAGASCVSFYITLCDFLSVFLKTYAESSACFANVSFVTVFTRYFIHTFTGILLYALVFWMYKQTSYCLKWFHGWGNTMSSVGLGNGFRCTYRITTVVLFISGSCVAALRLTFFCLTVSICLLTLLMVQSGYQQRVSAVWIWCSSCFLWWIYYNLWSYVSTYESIQR